MRRLRTKIELSLGKVIDNSPSMHENTKEVSFFQNFFLYAEVTYIKLFVAE